MTVLGRTLREAASRFGDQVLLAPEGGEPWTYAEVDRASDEVAAGLAARGIGDRSVVGLQLESTPEWIVAAVAASKLGALYSGVNPRLAPAEQAPVLARLDADLVLAPGDAFGLRVDGATPVAIPSPDPERPCVVVFTSGTTGEPKGAEFRERNIDAIVEIDLGPPRAREWGGGGPILVSTQFAHIGVSTKLAWYIRTGSRLHLLARWRPSDALAVTARERIPSIGGISAHIGLMLRQPDFDTYDLECVQTIVMGGGPSPAALVEEAKRRFGAAYSNRYSSTECGGCGTGTAFDADDEEALHTVGRGRGGVEVAIEDGTGVVLLRSGAVMAGYWRDPERTAAALDADGWLHTGDLGEIDERGCLRLTGRATDMYIRGGYNVHPGEVEAVLLSHPAVAQVAVVARPDEVLGEIGVAVVVPRDPSSPPTLEDLRSFGADGLASYKLPEALVLRDSLPLTTMDKLDRRRLGAEVARSSRSA
jgi:acyl-CoA synthetase (AMP-forming)/AMP-acid ligase II